MNRTMYRRDDHLTYSWANETIGTIICIKMKEIKAALKLDTNTAPMNSTAQKMKDMLINILCT